MKVKDITDKVIRFEFIKRNLDFFKGDNKEFVNEYGINSSNVVDLASFDFNNNIFYGFEIKSARDNLKRLKKQLSNYLTFFNIIYIVAYDRHLEGIEEILNENKVFDKVGIILVDKDLNFKEYKQAKLYKPFYDKFIKNLDMEELRYLCESKGLNPLGSKNSLVSQLKRLTKLEEIYEGIHNKLKRYHVKHCAKCGSNLYYNKLEFGNKRSYCYECGSIIPEFLV